MKLIKGKHLFKTTAMTFGVAALLISTSGVSSARSFEKVNFSQDSHSNTEGINNMATRYYLGDGVPKDYRKAAELFMIAAKRGNAIAQFNIGYMYQHGTGLPLDYFKAGIFCQAAAAQGVEGAIQSLKELQQYMSPDKIAEIERLAGHIADIPM